MRIKARQMKAESKRFRIGPDVVGLENAGRFADRGSTVSRDIPVASFAGGTGARLNSQPTVTNRKQPKATSKMKMIFTGT